MLTALYINKVNHKSRMLGTMSSLLPDRIKVEIKEADDISIRCVEYISHKDKINFKKIDRIVGAQRNHLLCDKNIALPKELGYRRFEGTEYSKRLCTNTAIRLLQRVKDERQLCVCLVDIDACFADIVPYLLKYTDKLVVITNKVNLYSQVADDMLSEFGAVLRISKNLLSTQTADLVIAPSYSRELKLKCENSVVLSVADTPLESNAIVIYAYDILLPKKLRGLLPKGITDTYLASALYSIDRRYMLGCVVPSLFIGKDSVYTIEALRKMLLSSVDKNLT